MIDWSKLKHYKSDKYKSFEELCFQIAKVLHGHKGRFTSVDDSGGGDGIEFYMALPNGDEWGWQAKFYYPESRLSASSRKSSIQGSLEKACKVHPALKKWFLCTPTNFTRDEQAWFDKTLPKSIPENMEVEIIHWGDSDFNNWLSEPRFNGKKNYFFGELELNIDWFRNQFAKQLAGISHKFNPVLHIETNLNDYIHEVLNDKVFTLKIGKILDNLQYRINEYNKSIRELESSSFHEIVEQNAWNTIKAVIIDFNNFVDSLLTHASSQINLARYFLSENQHNEIRSLNLDFNKIKIELEKNQAICEELEQKLYAKELTYIGKEKEKDKISREVQQVKNKAFQPFRLSYSLMAEIIEIFAQINSINQTELHILGNAGFGKTHIVSNICHERLNSSLPALLVLGSRFTSDRSLEEQLRGILDIPPIYSWNDFLQALDAAAEAYRTRIPLVIDGLNEATCNGKFSRVWQGLPGLIQEIGQLKNVVLITTSRSTYQDAIWSDNKPSNIKYANGFNEDVEKAVEKYFRFYKIKGDLTATPLEQFQHPIYLQIFCKNKNAERIEEKHIYVGEQTLFEVFEDYLNLCNRVISERLGLRRGTPVVTQALLKIAKRFWQPMERSIPLTDLAEIVDGQPLDTLNWQQSKTNAILDEGLLVCRDWGTNGEFVFFTYDLFGGYLIAKYLIKQAENNIQLMVQSEEIITALFSDNFRLLHPLYNDIGRCLAALIPVQTGLYLHNLIDNSKAFDLSVKALVEIPPENISEECLNLIESLFKKPDNRRQLLNLSASTIGYAQHPLNATFWSRQLRVLTMPERDISWTEYIRENIERVEKILGQFEGICKSDENLSEMMEERLYLLAVYIMWILTSTVRPLRDKVTRALYWYGRRKPEKFLELLLQSLKVNDPYVYERMLAAAYGIAMARQYDFKDASFTQNFLPLYGRKLYEAMFKPNAPHSTTHILARDYARRTIDIALLHYPELLTKEERQRITPPFQDGGIREWGKSEDRNYQEYRDGNCPFGFADDDPMQWLGKPISKYETKTPEYLQAKANLWWRIYNLGYSLEIFSDVDKWIVRLNYINSYSQKEHYSEHYGRKYCLIATYELMGYRDDSNLLKNEWDEPYERTSQADIDPSFPVMLQEHNLVCEDFLGNRDMPLHEWILSGGVPDVKSYLIVDELLGEEGSWVLLDGYINQEDSKFNRGRFTFLRCLIVKAEEANDLLQRLEKQNLGGRWLPEIPKDYYTYAGEIPWCDTYPNNGKTELSFELKFALQRNGQLLSDKEVSSFFESIKELLQANDYEAIDTAIIKNGLELVETSVENEAQFEGNEKFEVLIPVRNNRWEDYHSSIIPGRSVTTPAKEIAQQLDLCSQPQTYDLFDKSGRRASITFRYGEYWHSSQDFTYLRKDLLERFLSETNSELIWVIWGEREFHGDISPRDAFASQHEYYKVFQEIKTYREF
ncbi:hypothetical protein [Scytonema sp. PCC 10023]|uniref:hypothetical protein n=1 Tax=Scytonema sp. PCC 10023 TaxID=1680591 RepID=UPI0039C60002